ncbi:HNH endonuclease signature motif containing protein [Pseudomonas fragi]|uniref:HNH endonuclease n=1 Tax=Pseudomonas fragi TaxID=296 RepID=UPI0030A0247B
MTFDILTEVLWSEEHRNRIQKYFKGQCAEWTKTSLSSVRKDLRSGLLKVQNYTCAYCRRALSHEIGRNEIDHIVAKANLGMARFTYERMNLVAICKRCNKNKSDKSVLAITLTDQCPYPLKPTDYLWVHPYIHKYSEHIKIHEGYIFEPIGSKKKKARAQALINACGLSSMPEVERRRAFESISHASNVYLSVLTAIGQYPHIPDNNLAKMLKDTRPELEDDTYENILNLIIAVRLASFAAIEKAIKTAL